MNLGNRILILGSAGSGKSTLAKQLGSITKNPVVHLDCIFWLPNWTPRADDEVDQMIVEQAEKPSWIIDGNYHRTIDIRMQKADTVIFIDFNRLFCIFRVIKRRIQYRNKTRDDIGVGCKEKIDLEFLRWVWSYPKRMRKSILNKLDNLKCTTDKNILHLKSTRQVKNFLKTVENSYK